MIAPDITAAAHTSSKRALRPGSCHQCLVQDPEKCVTRPTPPRNTWRSTNLRGRNRTCGDRRTTILCTIQPWIPKRTELITPVANNGGRTPVAKSRERGHCKFGNRMSGLATCCRWASPSKEAGQDQLHRPSDHPPLYMAKKPSRRIVWRRQSMGPPNLPVLSVCSRTCEERQLHGETPGAGEGKRERRRGWWSLSGQEVGLAWPRERNPRKSTEKRGRKREARGAEGGYRRGLCGGATCLDGIKGVAGEHQGTAAKVPGHKVADTRPPWLLGGSHSHCPWSA